jgi:hypothetical protein
MKKTHLCLTFDVESDVSRIGGGFRGVQQGIPALLSIFENVEQKTRKKINATWFVTHDYWGKLDLQFPEIMGELANRNDELGLHVHFGKNNKYIFDEDFQRKLLVDGTDSLRSSGYYCKSFRGGGLHVDEITIKLLEELDYTVDSSVLSGLKQSSTNGNGWKVNHNDCIVIEPFYPNLFNHCLPGRLELLECPITMKNFFKFAFPPYSIENCSIRLQFAIGRGKTTGLGHAKIAPNESLDIFNKFLLQRLDREPRLIILTFHPWELFEACVYTNKIQEHWLKNIENWLIAIANMDNIEFSSLFNAAKNWKKYNPNKKNTAQRKDNTITLPGRLFKM